MNMPKNSKKYSIGIIVYRIFTIFPVLCRQVVCKLNHQHILSKYYEIAGIIILSMLKSTLYDVMLRSMVITCNLHWCFEREILFYIIWQRPITALGVAFKGLSLLKLTYWRRRQYDLHSSRWCALQSIQTEDLACYWFHASDMTLPSLKGGTTRLSASGFPQRSTHYRKLSCTFTSRTAFTLKRVTQMACPPKRIVNLRCPFLRCFARQRYQQQRATYIGIASPNCATSLDFLSLLTFWFPSSSCCFVSHNNRLWLLPTELFPQQ
jgi:hypothetical protein